MIENVVVLDDGIQLAYDLHTSFGNQILSNIILQKIKCSPFSMLMWVPEIIFDFELIIYLVTVELSILLDMAEIMFDVSY